jgi:hypothetical protein
MPDFHRLSLHQDENQTPYFCLPVTVMVPLIFLATGLLSVATSTGELGISPVLLSRCIVQYVNSMPVQR